MGSWALVEAIGFRLIRVRQVEVPRTRMQDLPRIRIRILWVC